MQKFPKHNVLPIDYTHPISKALEQKRIEFSPYTFCEFFQGFDVLQLQSQATKEFIFVLYFSGQLVGHVYLGERYSKDDLLTISKDFFPPNWDLIKEYQKKNPEVWYYKYAPSQYAFVFDKILEKVK